LDRTSRQIVGDAAEELVATNLIALGWRVLGRNVHAGRSELDIVAVDPGPPARLVIVEVRWRRSRSFGLPEETLDYRKRAHLRAGVGRLLEEGRLPGGEPLPSLPVALDFAVVEPGDVAGGRGGGGGSGGRKGSGGAAPVVRFYRDALS
jgi:Holliday junction resolvase-like predicted endonuclease